MNFSRKVFSNTQWQCGTVLYFNYGGGADGGGDGSSVNDGGGGHNDDDGDDDHNGDCELSRGTVSAEDVTTRIVLLGFCRNFMAGNTTMVLQIRIGQMLKQVIWVMVHVDNDASRHLYSLTMYTKRWYFMLPLHKIISYKLSLVVSNSLSKHVCRSYFELLHLFFIYNSDYDYI